MNEIGWQCGKKIPSTERDCRQMLRYGWELRGREKVWQVLKVYGLNGNEMEISNLSFFSFSGFFLLDLVELEKFALPLANILNKLARGEMISRMRNEDGNWKRKAENGGEENLINFSFFRFFWCICWVEFRLRQRKWDSWRETTIIDDEWHAERCEKLFFQ